MVEQKLSARWWGWAARLGASARRVSRTARVCEKTVRAAEWWWQSGPASLAGPHGRRGRVMWEPRTARSGTARNSRLDGRDRAQLRPDQREPAPAGRGR